MGNLGVGQLVILARASSSTSLPQPVALGGCVEGEPREEIATGRRKPFSEGLGRLSSKQWRRAVLFLTASPCWLVRLCPGEKLYVVKESKGQV